MGEKQKNSLMDREDFISMILGLAIVGVVILVLVNYFKSRSGRIDLAGVTDSTTTPSVTQTNENTSKNSQDTQVADGKGGEVKEEVKITGSEYTVAAGDSLWKIAVRKYGNGYKWVEIAKANKISLKRSGLIVVGQKLTLPEVTAKAALPAEHVVKAGESLSKIALNYYGDMYAWQKIANANKNVVSNPNLIFVNMKLVIPE